MARTPQEGAGAARRPRRRRERRLAVHPFDVSPRHRIMSRRPPQTGGPGERGRLAGWIHGGAELYGAPFYCLLGLGVAAALAMVYVALVGPTRAREQAALREKLERKPRVEEVGVLDEPDPLELIESSEAEYPRIGLPQVKPGESAPVLDTDGQPLGPVPPARPRRLTLVEEEPLERAEDPEP